MILFISGKCNLLLRPILYSSMSNFSYYIPYCFLNALLKDAFMSWVLLYFSETKFPFPEKILLIRINPLFFDLHTFCQNCEFNLFLKNELF